MTAPETILALLAAAGWATVLWHAHSSDREVNRLCDANLRLAEKLQALRRRHSRKPEVLAGEREKRAKVVDALKSGTAVVS